MKTKLILPIAGIAAVGAIATPLATLTSCSCGNNATVEIPEDALKIKDGVFQGIDTSKVDLSKVTALKLPEGVKEIADDACNGVFSGKSCSVDTIVFSKDLTKIGKGAFVNCDTITKLDFSTIKTSTAIDDTKFIIGDYAFYQFNTRADGQIVFPEANINVTEKGTFVGRLCQEGGLSANWFDYTTPVIEGITWDVVKEVQDVNEVEANWWAVLTPLAPHGYNTEALLLDAYAKEVKAYPSILIDDFLTTYAAMCYKAQYKQQKMTIENIVVTPAEKEGNKPLLSFDMGVVNKNQEGDVTTTYNIQYKNIPLAVKAQTNNEWTFVFDQKITTDKSWDKKYSITGTIKISGQSKDIDVAIESVQDFEDFQKDYLTLYQYIFAGVGAVSNYFQNQYIEER